MCASEDFVHVLRVVRFTLLDSQLCIVVSNFTSILTFVHNYYTFVAAAIRMYSERYRPINRLFLYVPIRMKQP